MDIWEQWLSVDRFSGSSAAEAAQGLQFIAGIRAWLLAQVRLAPGDTVLELGCGAGDFLPQLLDAVGPEGHVLGLDHSAGLCARAAQTVAGHRWAERCTIVQGDMRELPHGPQSVQAVVCRAVLQYAEDDLPRVAAEIARVLAPGGRLAAFEVLPGDGTPLLPVPRTAAGRNAHAHALSAWRRLPYALAQADLAQAFGPPAFCPVTVSAQVTDWLQPFARERFVADLAQIPRPGCPSLRALYTGGLDATGERAWASLLEEASSAAQRGAVAYLTAERTSGPAAAPPAL